MATYEIQSPDGQTYEVTAPDNASEAAVLAYAKSQFEKPAVSPAPTFSPEQAAEHAKKSQKSFLRGQRGVGQNTLQDIAAGATSTAAGLLDLPSKITGIPWLKSEIGDLQQGADKSSAAYIGGQIADPAAMAIGAGILKGAQALPAIPKAATATSNYLKTILGGGGAGAAITGLQGGDATEGGVFGAGVTAAIANPSLWKAVSALSNAARSVGNSLSATMSKGGRISVGQKMVLDNLPVEERETILKVLQSRGIDTSPLGSDLTSAEAIARGRIGKTVKSPAGARIAALSEDVAKLPGGEQLNVRQAQRAGESRDIMNTLSGGRGAKVDPLLGMSADDVAIAQADAARKATARKLYPTGDVTGDTALNEILGRPAVVRAGGIEGRSASNVPRVTQIGEDIPAKTVYQSVFNDWQQTPYKQDLPEVFAKYSIKSLQNQYRLMDKEATRLFKSAAAGNPVDTTLAQELLHAKRDLGSWLADKSPEWATANKIFAKQSQPVTQMETGVALKKKWEQSPEAFLKSTGALPEQEQMIRGITGRSGNVLSDVYNLGGMSKIAGLREEAQITTEVKKLSDLARASLSDEKAFQLPNLLNVWVAVANKLARSSAKSTVDDVTSAAADILANPAKMRALLNEDAARRAAYGRVPSTEGLGAAVGSVSGARQGMLSGGQP